MPDAAGRNPRTRIERETRHNVRAAKRSIGEDIRNARQDLGISLSRLAAASGVAKSYLHRIEAGEAAPSIDVLARSAAALGGRISLRFIPGTGPALRDHLQAAMLEALLAVTHRRWSRFSEVSVYRPIRGVIDLVLDEPDEGVLIASEVHSQMRRLEQQLRWAGAKADALKVAGSSELSAVTGERSVSRLLLLRNTASNRQVVATHPELIASVYPASHGDALASLTGTAPWPGSALLWAEVTRTSARIMDRPPRGLAVGT
jgi:transcriptional regulator with XRE-family HTH domain